MKRGYKESDWPRARRPAPGGEKISKRRKPGPTPIEEWIEKDKRKEAERPFDDDLPF